MIILKTFLATSKIINNMAAPRQFVYIMNRFKVFNKVNFIVQTTSKKCRKLSTKEHNSFRYCVDSVRKYDYENYLCTLLLPDAIRSSAFAIRAFNVEISQVRDSVSSSAIGEMRLKFWHNTLNKTFAGEPPEQPVAKQLAKVLQNHKLSKTWFQRLITSRESILNDKPFVTIKDAEDYCESSVVPVYFLFLQILGINSIHCDHVASHIGKCQGICNLIRGIPYNARHKRAFLPLELMSKHRLSHQDLIHGNQNKNLQDAVYDISSIAHQHLSTARQLSKDVSKSVKPLFLPAVACAAYLKNLQKTNFDVFHPKNQVRNNWLPVQLLLYKLINKY